MLRQSLLLTLLCVFLLTACQSPPTNTGINTGITGVITTSAGTPAANLEVEFQAADSLGATADTNPTTTTDANGTYSISLPAGTYNAISSTEADGASSFGINVKTNQVTTADLRLTPLSHLQGKAHYPDRTNHLGILVTIPGTPLMTSTTADGNFTLSLPEGEYTLAAVHANYAPAQQRISISAGEIKTLEQTLVLAGLPGFEPDPEPEPEPERAITGTSPEIAVMGDTITIIGVGFGSTPGRIKFHETHQEYSHIWDWTELISVGPNPGEKYEWTDTKITFPALGRAPIFIGSHDDSEEPLIASHENLIIMLPKLLATGTMHNCVEQNHSYAHHYLSCYPRYGDEGGPGFTQRLESPANTPTLISFDAIVTEAMNFSEPEDINRPWRTPANQEFSITATTYEWCSAPHCGMNAIKWTYGYVKPMGVNNTIFTNLRPGNTNQDGYAHTSATVTLPPHVAFAHINTTINGKTYPTGQYEGDQDLIIINTSSPR